MKGFKITDSMIEDATPPAENMIESLRNFGYELTTAVADLLDNSITHEARNIWIDCHWDGPDSWLTITDDGEGMDDVTLFEAMRPSSRNSLDDRAEDDLGRFSLGLKTASFSQARRLTVFSKRSLRTRVVRTWDLDLVANQKKWALLNTCYPESENKSDKLNELNKGTLVLWEKMDRIVDERDPDNDEAREEFYRKFNECGKHLAMVFHRKMKRGRNGITFYLNDKKIAPWDPFMRGKSEVVNNDTISYEGENVMIESWVLPHHSKLSDEEHSEGAGIKGWNDHQGFYLYRNERMIMAGGWLDLNLKTEEHCKLGRIMVDIPNSLDQEFQIDVLKSQSQIPSKLRRRFRAAATDVRSKATAVYRWRGNKQVATRKRALDIPVWSIRELRNKWGFKIDPKHPVVEALVSGLDRENKKLFRQILSLLEETVPTEWVRVKESEEPDARRPAFEGKSEKEILETIRDFYGIFRQTDTKAMAIRKLRGIEGLGLYDELIEKVKKESK
ncbi:ATP-binding protein [bacterium]|nr:ATP-binding protein [bacterium]